MASPNFLPKSVCTYRFGRCLRLRAWGRRDVSWGRARKSLDRGELTAATACELAIDVHEVGEVLGFFILGRVRPLLRWVKHF